MDESKIEMIKKIRKPNSKTSVFEEIRKYVFSNLLSVIWSAALFVGGIIFWIYFFQIKYFPDLTFDESVLLLLLASITGIFFLLLMAAMIMTPYYFRWIMLKSCEKGIKPKGALKELVWYYFSMYLAIILIFLLFFKDKKFSNLNEILHWIFVNDGCISWVLGIFIVIMHLFIYFPFKEKANSGKQGGGELILLLAWFYSVLTLFVPLFILEFIAKKAEISKDQDQIMLFGLFFLIIFAANFAYAYYHENFGKKKWWVPLIPIFAVLSAFFMVKKPIIPELVMQKFRLGGFPVTRLILNEAGCKILRSHNLKPVPVKNEKTLNPKECFLEDIKIQSRLGSVYVLVQEFDNDNTINFNIPKDSVLSWSVVKPKD